MGSSQSKFEEKEVEDLRREILTYGRILNPNGLHKIIYAFDRAEELWWDDCTHRSRRKIIYRASLVWASVTGLNEAAYIRTHTAQQMFCAREWACRKTEPYPFFKVRILRALLVKVEKDMVAKYGPDFKKMVMDKGTRTKEGEKDQLPAYTA